MNIVAAFTGPMRSLFAHYASFRIAAFQSNGAGPPLRELGLFVNAPRVADLLIMSFQLQLNE
jgi:hypothetical protein